VLLIPGVCNSTWAQTESDTSTHVYIEIATSYRFVISSDGGIAGVGDVIRHEGICSEPPTGGVCSLYRFLNIENLEDEFDVVEPAIQYVWGQRGTFAWLRVEMLRLDLWLGTRRKMVYWHSSSEIMTINRDRMCAPLALVSNAECLVTEQPFAVFR